MQKILFLGLVFMAALTMFTLPANADRGRHGTNYGGHGGYRGFNEHGGHSNHGGGYVGIGVYLGPGWWGPAWRGPYSYYPYYPYYPVPILVQQPSTEIFVQEVPRAKEPDYWYYCRESQGFYPDVDRCPGGWLKVVSPDSPPQ